MTDMGSDAGNPIEVDMALTPYDGVCDDETPCDCGPTQPCAYHVGEQPHCHNKSCEVTCLSTTVSCRPQAVGDGGRVVCNGPYGTCEPKCTGDCTTECLAQDATCLVSCNGNSTCALICAPQSKTCAFEKCRNVTDCGNGRLVCNGSC